MLLFNEHGPRRQSNEDEHGVRAEHDGTNASSSWQSEQRVLHAARPTQQQVQGPTHLGAQFTPVIVVESFTAGGAHVDVVVEW